MFSYDIGMMTLFGVLGFSANVHAAWEDLAHAAAPEASTV
jgi:hypothetical protein